MTTARLVDAAVSDRVLVFGSLPPHGRDLDVLVRRAQGSELDEALPREGFAKKGYVWARFSRCSTEAIEAVPAADWSLDGARLDSLFSEALVLDGYSQLVRPAPAAAMVILARRMVRAGGELEPAKRDRVRRALEEEPDVWAKAQRVGHDWGCYEAVIALERLFKSGVPTSVIKRAGALAEWNRSAGRSSPRLRAWRTVLKPARGKGVVAFSGLDGSGKTSQAEALRDVIERTTGDSVVVWTRLSYNPSLKALARPIKSLLGAKRRVAPVAGAGSPDAGKELRRRSAVVTQSWATAVALANATAQRRVTRYHLRRGRTVVCDRYTLDSRVHLRYRYGTSRRFALQGRLIAAISPKPLRAYLMEVPAEVAYERKAEQYNLEQLQLQARLYRDESDVLGAKTLDGTRPKEELCSEIAEEVWRSL